MQGFAFDAIHLFQDAIAADPKGDLADDALFNVGTTYLRMRLVADAEQAFTELIERFPESTIASVASPSQEHGRTAAKALLGRMQARLAQGNVEGARSDLDALSAYEDSWVVDPAGRRRTYAELARAILGD